MDSPARWPPTCSLPRPDVLERVEAWLETTSANPAARRLVGEGRSDLTRALAAQACDAR